MKIVFATSNPHKLREIRGIVPDIDLLGLRDIEWNAQIEETENTLAGNAVLKARTIADTLEIDCFAEDTGLEVDALEGAPGVFTARFAGPDADAGSNMRKLLESLDGIEDRAARFRTVIALIIDGAVHTFEGKVEGRIAHRPSGEGGFGYDPVFIPENETRTFAEMSDDEKNQMSHRARATQKFTSFLKGYITRKNP